MIPVIVKLTDNTVLAGLVETDEGEWLDLRECRMIVYWPQQAKGLFGLTKAVPKGCRITTAAERCRVPNNAANVRFIARMKEVAWKDLCAEPWG